MPQLKEPHCPTILTEKSPWELFPPEKLVYLSPDSRTDLVYKPDDIYVIGGLVDPGTENPATLSTAKRLGIRHARLPLKRTVG
jgi:Trm5-related predicted tRNA methylase